MLDTAIVGLGEVATWHRRALAATDGARLTAVVDTDPDRLQQVTDEWDVPGYGDLETLLGATPVDWVHVCTPAQTHRALAETCIDHGVAVLVEKPFVLTRADYRAVVRAADEADVRVGVVHNQVYYDPVQRAHRRLQAGEFGPVRGVSVRWAEDIDPRDADRGAWVLDLPGGEFGEGIVHPIYVCLRLGGYPADAGAVTTSTIATVADVALDGVAVSYTTADDTVCAVQHHSNTPDRRRIDIAAEHAHVTVDVPTQSVRVQRRSYGPNADSDRPLARAAVDGVTTAVHGAYQAARRQLRARRSPADAVHDTHTPVVRREAAAVRDGGVGATPREELRWTTHILAGLTAE